MPRSNRGRQRVEMVRMENESNLQVTFSKRRAGLFKKASELCTLCGAEVAIVVFSPGNKPYSFGHPNVEELINRFINNTPPPQATATEQILEAFRANNVNNLNSEVSQLMEQEELLKKRRKEIKQVKESRQTNWWETPINEMTKPQLLLYKAAIEHLKADTVNQAQALQAMMQLQNPHFCAANQASSSSDPPPRLHFDPLRNAGFIDPNVPGPSHDYNNHMNFGYDHGKFY